MKNLRFHAAHNRVSTADSQRGWEGGTRRSRIPMDEVVASALAESSASARECYVGDGIPRLQGTPRALQFYRRYVAFNRPCVVSECISGWPALHNWKDDGYLKAKLKSTRVHVAQTPNGLADAVVPHPSTGERVFAKPHEAEMTFESFLAALETPLLASDDAVGEPRATRPVHYCSHQNSSFTKEFRALWGDADASLPWADEAFGAPPEAVNFWMGEDAARTTAHQDLYENLYVVVRGSKTFTLLPPQDVHRLGIRPFRDARWAPAADGSPRMELHLEGDPSTTTPWIPYDLEDEAFCAAAGLAPLRVTLHPGELLYIPSHWFHAVSQRAGPKATATIAVNYWYAGEAEASLGPAFVQRGLLNRLAEALPRLPAHWDDLYGATPRFHAPCAVPSQEGEHERSACRVAALSSMRRLPSLVRDGDLLLLDIDETLVRPEGDATEPWFNSYCSALLSAGAAKEVVFAAGVEIWQALQHVCRVGAPEGEETSAALRAIVARAHGVDVVGLTARGPEIATQTADQIRRCGCYDGVFATDLTLGPISATTGDGRVPLTHVGGVVYCSGSRKPAGLRAYAAAVGVPPARRVVLVDDRKAHIEALRAMCEEDGRPFLGLHYLPGAACSEANVALPRGWQLLAQVFGSDGGRHHLRRMLRLLDTGSAEEEQRGGGWAQPTSHMARASVAMGLAALTGACVVAVRARSAGAARV